MFHTKNIIKKNLQKNYFLSFLLLSIPVYMHAADENNVIATINVGVTPAGIGVTPNNHYAYVANNNNYGIDCEDTVSVLNLKKNTLKTTISDSSFNQPYTVTINHKGKKAYVTNSNSTTISVIDIKKNEVKYVIDGFDGPSGMVITPRGDKAYVNNYGGPDGVGSGNGTTVSVVDLKTRTIIGAPITVGLAPAALDISPDGKFVYVVNYVDGNPGTGTMSIIKTSNNTVVDTITGFSGPFAIKICPDGKYAYVTNFGSNNFNPIGTTVTVVNLHHHALHHHPIKATIELGIQPAGIALTRDGHYAYVSNYNTLYSDNVHFTGLTPGQGTVNIINTDTYEVTPTTIVVGQSPSAIAISSNDKHVYVTNFTSNTVTVIERSHEEEEEIPQS
jgi:YVTN family beta-propeller protein